MANNTAKITALEDAIAAGTSSVTIDGTTVTYRSLAEMTRTLNRLRDADDQVVGMRRPPAATIKLGGF